MAVKSASEICAEFGCNLAIFNRFSSGLPDMLIFENFLLYTLCGVPRYANFLKILCFIHYAGWPKKGARFEQKTRLVPHVVRFIVLGDQLNFLLKECEVFPDIMYITKFTGI
jgi:hypothetical protein